MAEIQFLLNDQHVSVDAAPGLLVLDYLRQNARLTGTKEGCKEGDCGACSLLIGKLTDDGVVRYEPVTGCLVPLGEVHGKHVVTVEGLNLKRALNPVQQAVVDHGASQCGYCTPGFIVSMCWYVMQGQEPAPTMDGFKRAMSGNLCRCTGYASLKRASQQLIDQLSEGGPLAAMWDDEDRVGAMARAGLWPEHFSRAAEALAQIPPALAFDPEQGAEYFIAGGTDLYVQRGEHIPEADVRVLHFEGLKGIERREDHLHIGALTTFEELAQHPDVRVMLPEIDGYMSLIASLHIRNRATLSGNIINASPIGDVSILLLALEAELELTNGHTTRVVPMRDFFLNYKVIDKRADELVSAIRLPLFDPASTRGGFEKVSKRKYLDIATVNAALKLTIDDAGVVQHASIAVGGVAPVPKWLARTSAMLIGQTLDAALVRRALEVMQSEIAPISDVRGSADYKRLLAEQLLVAQFARLFPARVRAQDVMAAS